MKRVMFTVYKQYFDAIEAQTKTIEYRDLKAPWISYIENPPDEAVFVCGNRHRLIRRVDKVVKAAGKVEFWLSPIAGNDLVHALDDCHDKFQDLLHKEANTPEFWLNLLHQQLIDARQHVEDGNLDKYADEVADCFSVGWQALRCLGKLPEPTIVRRVRTRIIPRAEELAERDRAGNGYKPRGSA